MEFRAKDICLSYYYLQTLSFSLCKKGKKKSNNNGGRKERGVNWSSRFFTILGDKDTTWNERRVWAEGTKGRYPRARAERERERGNVKDRWQKGKRHNVGPSRIYSVCRYSRNTRAVRLQWRDGEASEHSCRSRVRLVPQSGSLSADKSGQRYKARERPSE